MENWGRFLFYVTNSDLPSQSQQPRTSPRQDDRDRLQGREQWVREGSVLGLEAVILPGPPWRSSSREQQAAHLVWELRRGGRRGGDCSPQASHKSQLCGQGAGGGQGPGAAAAAHTGQGREARVGCGCKLSPKCFQVKANQGAVTEHARPHPAPVDTLTSVQAHTHTDTKTRLDMFYIQSCACEGVTLIPGHTKTHAHQNYYFYVCMCSPTHTHTHTQAARHPLRFIQTQGYKDLPNIPQHLKTHRHTHTHKVGLQG